MEEFLIAYKSHIIWILGVIGAVCILYIITNLAYKWILKKEQKKFPLENASPIKLIKKVLNILWLILGIIALSFVFVNREKDALIIKNFWLVAFLGFLAVFTIIAATSTNMWFKTSINKKIQNKYDPTSYKFLRYVAVTAIYFIGLLMGLLAFPSLRGVAQTALGGAGVLAIVIGVASQEALANLVGGVFIISFKPFRVGDLIKVTDTMVGTVTDITLRHTIIRDFENKMIVIPNSIINKEKLVNYNLGELKCCERIEIGISYDSDIDLAKKIMQEECENHPLILDNRSIFDKENGAPLVKTAVISLNDSSITVRAWAWGRRFEDCFELKTSVLESIKKRFDKEGVEIPFPYRTIVMKEKKVAKTEIETN